MIKFTGKETAGKKRITRYLTRGTRADNDLFLNCKKH